MALTEVEKPQLKELAYERLKAEIVSLAFPPGTWLREADVAARMGMSKTPFREACVRLAADGLVEIVPYRGAVVLGYDADDLREIFELREVVEGLAARHAATDLDDTVRGLFEKNLADSRVAMRVNDRAQLAYLITEFDRIVYGRTRNSRARALLDQLRCHIDRIGGLSAEIPGRLERSISEHAVIVDAILAGDPGAAETRMREHIRSVLADQLRSQAAHTDAED